MIQQTHFLLCEDVRVERSGQLTLVGFIPNRPEIRVAPNAKPILLHLYCVVGLSGFEDVRDFRYEVQVRRGAVILVRPETHEVKRVQQGPEHTIAHRLPEIQLTEPGDYTVEMRLLIEGRDPITFSRSITFQKGFFGAGML